MLENATNYNLLRIVWRYTKNTNSVTEENWSDSTSNAIAYYYDIRNKRDFIVTGRQKINLGAVFYAQEYAYARRAYFTADNVIHFNNAYQFQNDGIATDSGMVIPLFIDGVNA